MCIQVQASAEFWKCKIGVYKHDTVSMSILNTEEFHSYLWKPKGVPTSKRQGRQE